MPGQKPSSLLLSAATFILLEVAALVLLHSSSTLQNIWLNRASHRTMAFLWGSGETVRSQFQMEELNRGLQAENARLQERLRVYEALGVEQAELDRMAARESAAYRYTPATVVKMSRNRTHNYIILNKGSEDGIHPQSGIISDLGVVGVVEAVDKHFSYGLTLMNPEMSIGARLGRSQLVAPLSWDGRHSGRAILRDLPPHFDVAPGDTVRTSGFSTIFPPDIPIGITGDSRLVDGSTRQVDVELFQDFSKLRYVTVVENKDRTTIMALEAEVEDAR
ncbi:MAG: rod shape-determining protein MreC [Bacteroidales bacterium]|nr:rod shape-determining protein MreC [Bacteroidales bacterium]